MLESSPCWRAPNSARGPELAPNSVLLSHGRASRTTGVCIAAIERASASVGTGMKRATTKGKPSFSKAGVPAF